MTGSFKMSLVTKPFCPGGFLAPSPVMKMYATGRVYAAKVHWQRKKEADAILPVLLDALDRKRHQSYYYEEVLNSALSTLGDMGGAARPAASEVAKLTQDPNPKVAKLATDTLNKIGR